MDMTPDLQSCLLCDDVRREQNGKLMLIGCFDALWGKSFPLKHPRVCMVTRWCSGVGEFIQQSRILQPDRQTPVAAGPEIPVKLADELHCATNVELFVNLQFPEPGPYWVEIKLNDALRLSFPLRVGRMETPPNA